MLLLTVTAMFHELLLKPTFKRPRNFRAMSARPATAPNQRLDAGFGSASLSCGDLVQQEIAPPPLAFGAGVEIRQGTFTGLGTGSRLGLRLGDPTSGNPSQGEPASRGSGMA